MWTRRFALILLAACSVSAFGAETLPAAAGLYPDLARLTLRQAADMFVERNRELQAARRNVEGAEADTLSAAARPNPVAAVNVSGLGPRNTTVNGVSATRYPDTIVSLSQTFERGNKRELRTEAAQFGVDASRSDLADTLRLQQVVLADAYYALLFAQMRARIAEDSALLFRRTMSAVELRLKAGDVAASDVSRIRVDALRAENEARLARADLAKAQTALAYLIGAEAQARRIVADDGWPAPTLPPESDPESVLEHRADVQAAVARLKAAEKRVGLARALRTRNVDLGVQYENYREDTKNNTVGFTVSVPLFVNYYFEGEIARAEVEYTAAQEDLGRVRALALGDIERSRADLDAAAERARRYDELLLKEAERAAKGAELAYEKGASGVLELLDARRTLYASRIEAVGARADYARALAAWLASVGESPDASGAAERAPVETPQ
ncbi:MAG TPA: TolC family protein [Burkholderiales bacterium]|nr:TolC family protein [Betaproteobacteria bacterium]HQR52664.1 TolC family protein [Burkholderiales bacterium]